MGIAKVYAKHKKFKYAKEFGFFAAESKNDSFENRAEAYLWLAELCYINKDGKTALDCYRHAFTYKPSLEKKEEYLTKVKKLMRPDF